MDISKSVVRSVDQETCFEKSIISSKGKPGKDVTRMSQGDYYQILGVERSATPRNIKEAYRRLAFQYHPDRNKGNPAAVEMMKEINEAYAVLSDPRKRKDYERLREQYGASGYDRFRQSYSEQDIFRGSDIHQVFEEMARGFGFRNFDEVFRESYGQGYRTFEFQRPGVFGRGFIYLGSARKAGHPPGPQTSSDIFPGYLGKFIQHLLKKVLGIEGSERGKDWHDVIALDPRQAREGRKLKYVHRRKKKELLVTIPPGIRDGQRVRLRGMGEEGKGGRGPGDLYLKVQVGKSLFQKARGFLGI